MTDSTDDVALETIELLEARLRRIQYIVTGNGDSEELVAHTPNGGLTEQTVGVRLTQLEHDFHRLCQRSKTVQEILRLHARYPDWLEPIPPEERPSLLSDEELRATVLSYATLFPTMASQLTAVFDVPVPPAETSIALMNLQPRIDRWMALQEEQGKQVAWLQQRSAALLERWYNVAILGSGECWAEWDSRITQAEQRIKRAEAAREREEKGI